MGTVSGGGAGLATGSFPWSLRDGKYSPAIDRFMGRVNRNAVQPQNRRGIFIGRFHRQISMRHFNFGFRDYLTFRFGNGVGWFAASGTAYSGMAGDHCTHSSAALSFSRKAKPLVAAA